MLRRKGGFVLFALTLSLLGGVFGGLIAWSLNTVISVDFVSVPYVDRLVGSSGLGGFPALMLVNLALNTADKFLTTAAVWLAIRLIPPRVRESVRAAGRTEGVEDFDMNRQYRRIMTATAAEAIALVAVCAWISVALYTETARKERIGVAVGAAQQVVNAVDPRLVDVYLERGYAAKSYAEVKSILQGIRDNSPDLEYVYVYRILEDGCHVVFDAVPEGEETDAPGAVVPFDASFEPYLPTLFAGGSIDPIESDDTYGWLLTVYQPIYDLDGTCVAYAGVDVSMQSLRDYVRDFLLRVVLIASGFLVISLAVGMRMSGGYHDVIRRQYEQIKEAKEEADDANQAKSHFLANMSHEIRTPINAVLGMNEMILRESEDETVLRYAENVKAAGGTLLGIINDILDFSKIEAGKMEILPVDYDLSSTLNDLVNMIRTRADDKGLLLRASRIIALDRLQKELQIEVKRQTLRAEHLTREMMLALSKAVDARDHYTNGHSERVAAYAAEIARRMGKNPREQEHIYEMGLLHDIGKIGVPEEIINKTSRLTDAEFEQIKRHTVTGGEILELISEMPELANGARSHHEKYDGSGYPDGLRGTDIPEAARIICLADCYDAMTSTRAYSTPKPQEKVRAEIARCAGTQFDPEIAKVLLAMIDEDRDYVMTERHGEYRGQGARDQEPLPRHRRGGHRRSGGEAGARGQGGLPLRAHGAEL